VGLAVAFAVPSSRYWILALVHNEPLHGGRSVSSWVTALQSSDANVRKEAALALEDVSQELKGRPPDDAETKAAIAGLVGAMADPDPFVRKCVAKAFLSFPRDTVVPDDAASVSRMLTALEDKNEVLVRKAGARALWQAGAAAKQGAGVPALTAATYDKDDFVREYAARALGRIGPEAVSAVPELLDLLRKDEERDVREHAAKSLGLIGAQALGPRLADVKQALMAGLVDEAADVRENSARSLGQLGATEAIPEIQRLADDEKEPERVRAAAAEAVKRLKAGK